MDSTAFQTPADRSHTCIYSNLFELVEKLRTELQKKDEELEEKNRKYMVIYNTNMANFSKIIYIQKSDIFWCNFLILITNL
jgi:hypothetical protein